VLSPRSSWPLLNTAAVVGAPITHRSAAVQSKRLPWKAASQEQRSPAKLLGAF